MLGASILVEVFALPLTTLGVLITFRYEIYEDMQNYSNRLIDFVTKEIENSNTVTPADVHDWSSTLRAAKLYHRSCDAAVYFGYGSIASWLMMLPFRFNILHLGSITIPIINATIATMAMIFSFGLFSLLFFTVGSLFYIDHTRATAPTSESQSGAQAGKDSNY